MKNKTLHNSILPKEVATKVIEWAKILCLVNIYFKGEATKAILWMDIPNHGLGGISPKEMIINGRYKKLLKWVKNQLDENK